MSTIENMISELFRRGVSKEELEKVMNEVYRGKEKIEETKPLGNGFKKALFLDQPLIDFLRSVNFGNDSLQKTLDRALDLGVLNRSILTSLFSIYTRRYMFEVEGRKYFRAGSEMKKNLGSYLTKLEDEDRAKPDSSFLDFKGNMKPRFNRKQFVYNRLQSIITLGIVSSKTPDENIDTINMLSEIESIISQIL